MKTYIGTKIIQAEPCEKDYGPPETHGQPGYRIVYPDGYTSWSPKTAFEEACRETSAMSFGLAIEAMKKGSRVARTWWDGKKMWIVLVKADNYIIYAAPHGDGQDTSEGECKELLPWIGMKTTDDHFVPWTASQTDMLADDWQIVE